MYVKYLIEQTMSKESKYKSKSTYFIIDRSFIRKFAYKLQNLFLCFLVFFSFWMLFILQIWLLCYVFISIFIDTIVVFGCAPLGGATFRVFIRSVSAVRGAVTLPAGRHAVAVPAQVEAVAGRTAGQGAGVGGDWPCLRPTPKLCSG